MAICTLEQVKTYNNITVSTYDALIELKIKTTEEFIHSYTNNNFVSANFTSCKDKYSKGYKVINETNVYISSEFVFDKTAKTITSTYDAFADLEEDDNIVLCQSIRNNGFYTITDKTSDKEIVVKESIKSGTDTACIALLDYDDNISYLASKMIGYDILLRDKTQGLTSQSIDSWSESYTDNGESGYPVEITIGLKRYKLMRNK